MDELKLLIEMVANLPALAVWVLAGYLFYKVVVVGSVYGVLRLLIVKLHDGAVRPKEYTLGAKTISESVAQALEGQLARLATTSYIHASDVEKLKKAIDALDK